jgi:cytochrome c biogenesis protein CcmG/thiol:disulfide interchange protein DsbE
MRKYILIIISLLSLVILSISCEREKKEEVSALESDRTYAKDFSLFSLDGNKKIELKDFKGSKPLVINFWASWCAPCRQEMPFFEKVWNKYKDKGVIFIGIDVLDEEKNAKEFLNLLGISYVNLKDPSGEVSSTYGVVGLPTTFFIDKEGRIVRKNYGPFLGEEGEKRFLDSLEEIIK